MVSTGLKSPGKSIVLIGMMGAGKTCIGRRLAERMGIPFADADEEIEKAAGCNIEDIFSIYGEAAFRDVERRVIARLLDGPPMVLATGGGAYMDPETRAKVRSKGISVWLRAELDLLLTRVSRRNDRPLLKSGNKRATLEKLMGEREPIYAEADLAVDTGKESPESTVGRVLSALEDYREAPAP